MFIMVYHPMQIVGQRLPKLLRTTFGADRNTTRGSCVRWWQRLRSCSTAGAICCFLWFKVNNLALAQHRGDQAETVLFNLLRGAEG